MRLLFTILLVMPIPLSLYAAFTTTYTPVSQLIFDESNSPIASNRLVAHLGTVLITRNDPEVAFRTPYFLTIGH